MLKDLTISQIKKAIMEKNVYSRDLLQALLDDDRAGVQKLGRKLQKEMDQRQKRIKNFKDMEAFDRKFRDENGEYLVGVDEVGRGPLAGPVVAAAVILPKRIPLYGIQDSKELTSFQREELFCQIHKFSISIGLGLVEPEEIDRLNIGKASLKAMEMAISGINKKIDGVLIDGNQRIPDSGFKQTTVIGGDNKSLSIAAASIVAKVLRDWIMDYLDTVYPGYGLVHNKGYGSPDHLKALKLKGPTPIHRLSFAPVQKAKRQKGGTLFD